MQNSQGMVDIGGPNNRTYAEVVSIVLALYSEDQLARYTPIDLADETFQVEEQHSRLEDFREGVGLAEVDSVDWSYCPSLGALRSTFRSEPA